MSSTRHAITPAEVRHVARLARLAIDDQKLPEITAQLEPILGYIDQINEVDTTGVAPMDHAVRLTNVLRDDVVEPGLPLEQTLRNAPEVDGSFFRVPKVIGDD